MKNTKKKPLNPELDNTSSQEEHAATVVATADKTETILPTDLDQTEEIKLIEVPLPEPVNEIIAEPVAEAI
ncbi:MAG: hypothetical protein WCK84_11720, partial [Bacteroidota bacterium]